MIGIMDWGIGGLSVYKALREGGRSADVLYFADSGCKPYGRLSRAELRGRLMEIAALFDGREVCQILVACHAASSALETDVAGMESFGGVSFWSILPASRRVVERSGGKRLGVIGGELTIGSKVYERTLAGLGKEVGFCATQPLSAFVEAGELNSPAVQAEVRRLLKALGPIDSLLFACTHYPALAPVFASMAPELELLDPGAELAGAAQQSGAGRFEFLTTGDRQRSASSARAAFGVDISGGHLIAPGE